MPLRLSKKHLFIFSFIFAAALLFFGITKQVSTDVAAAKATKQQELFKHRVIEIATTTPSLTPVNQTISEPEVIETAQDLSTYLQVTDSCSAYYGGECLRVRSGPGTNFPVIGTIRNGMVLKVADTITRDGQTWHKVIFDEWLRYPERHNGDWYVAAAYVTTVQDEGTKTLESHPPVSISTKSIIVDRSDQKVYAYDDEELFMTATTSTGLDLTPTPRGTFTIFKKMPSRYMQGPLPNISDDYYDLPGVPWTMYFTEGGAAIHGAYWHNKFGTQHSHGCVNLEPDIAQVIYNWADLGTKVTVRD
jgi:lipoprotein-anchoring transpeptidase ErfK/SrfK